MISLFVGENLLFIESKFSVAIIKGIPNFFVNDEEKLTLKQIFYVQKQLIQAFEIR